MKYKYVLRCIVVFMVQLMPLSLAINNALAIYAGDGSTPNGTTGEWDITDYGQCVYGIDAAGGMSIGTETSRPDCLAHIFTSATTSNYNSSANCTKTAGRDNGDVYSHYWASTCVANDGTAISLDGLDRTSTMCDQAAKKAGKLSGTWASACTSSWVYTGPAHDGAPGFCYTKIDVTNLYGTSSACPTSTYGYKWASNKCSFDYGIKGLAFAAIAYKASDLGNYAAALAPVDLSSLTLGQCLADGGTWKTGVTKSGPIVLDDGSAPGHIAQTIANVTDVRAGCLECHNDRSQNNGLAARWKNSYLHTGHKNMLRKVTAGNIWKGPDGNGMLQTYTAAATGDINFEAATAKISGVDKPLLYLFGDWMAPAPDGLDVIVNMAGSAKYNGTSDYSCAPCHTTGWSRNEVNAGVCTKSQYTTTAACTGGGGTWVPTSGVQGASYVPPEPLASFPGITFTKAGTWDRDSILCSRCHNSVFAPTGSNANGATFDQLTGTDTHNSTPKNTTNETVNNLCYGCHQSIAKTSNGTGLDNDLTSATILPVKNTATSPAYVPEFNSHVIGGEFLNSPHARYTGAIYPNSLGKYDLVINTTANYDSEFKGYVCRSSTTAGGGDVLETVIKGSPLAQGEIESLADCNLANGFGSVVTPDTTERGYWQAESQGSCTTCHDVHNSLFSADTEEKAIKRECTTCHWDNPTQYGAPPISVIRHPSGVNTPLEFEGQAANSSYSCEKCHMPKATDAGYPQHLWRINTDPAYSTFPTSAEFLGNTKKVANTDDDGGEEHADAVWVDLTRACGQCHGDGGAATHKFTSAQLAPFAEIMHTAGPKFACSDCHIQQPATLINHPRTSAFPTPPCAACHTPGVAATVATACNPCHGGSAGPRAVHNGAPYLTALYLTNFARTIHKNAPPKATMTLTVTADRSPLAGLQIKRIRPPATPDKVYITNTSTDANNNLSTIKITWGDGTSVTYAPSSAVKNHSYSTTGTKTITLTATDTNGLKSTVSRTINVIN